MECYRTEWECAWTLRDAGMLSSATSTLGDGPTSSSGPTKLTVAPPRKEHRQQRPWPPLHASYFAMFPRPRNTDPAIVPLASLNKVVEFFWIECRRSGT